MRPPTVHDIDAIHALANVIHAHDGRPFPIAREEIAELWEHPDDDPQHDARVIDHPVGDGLIAWGRVGHAPAGERSERAFLDGGVHPDHRRQGHGQDLFAWLDRRAADRLASTPDHLRAVILVDRFADEADRVPLLRRFGYEDARWFDELQRPLVDLPAVPAPDGIDLVPWDGGHDTASCHVYNAAFADHWGSTPRTIESWVRGFVHGYGARPDLSFVAIDRAAPEYDGVVAYCLNSHYPDDVTYTGRQDGWIASLATLRSHRGLGIASALIARSLHAFADAGLDSTMLGVDTENESGAYGIYERLGYRRLHRSVTAMKVVRTGAAATTRP